MIVKNRDSQKFIMLSKLMWQAVSIKALIIFLLFFINSSTWVSCQVKGRNITWHNLKMKNKTIVLTKGDYGHFLNDMQCFSKDGQWIVYDTRNADGEIASTGSIEMVNVETGEIKSIYQTLNQTLFGPGVGAVSFSPVADTVIFIQGIRNANENNPYGFTRRTGIGIDINYPNQPIFMDARDITSPFTPGALRGGTHAHRWSGDGQWISFTYNDYVMEQAAKTNPKIKDLRTVGIMYPGAVIVDTNNMENNDGQMYSVIITKVSENPLPGSDDIDKAFDEGWIGKNGYRKPDGTWQHRAIAFQGNVLDQNGMKKTEIFVIDLPDDLSSQVKGKSLSGTKTSRPQVPEVIQQRRISFLNEGVAGPRHWLKSTPDGRLIIFLSRDENKKINAYGISPNGGTPRQLSSHNFDIQSGINISPDGNSIAYFANGSIYVTDINTGISTKLTETFEESKKPVSSVNWSPDGKVIAFNCYVKSKSKEFLQIFIVRILY